MSKAFWEMAQEFFDISGDGIESVHVFSDESALFGLREGDSGLDIFMTSGDGAPSCVYLPIDSFGRVRAVMAHIEAVAEAAKARRS